MLLGIPVSSAEQTQTTGSILGTVKDQTGARIAGAKIHVIRTSIGEQRSLQSDSSGSFSIPLLQPGLYKLDVSAPEVSREVTRRFARGRDGKHCC
jgi:uncharacterized surface anchored protein